MASSSSPSRSQPAVAATLLGLPELLLGQRIVAHPALDPAARLALFRSCHTLARMVLLHAPSDKRVAHHFSGKDGARHWSQRTAALARLLSAKWQPLPPFLDLELRLEPAVLAAGAALTRPQLPSIPPPPSIACHVSRLTLRKLSLTLADLAAWQLHDPVRWPHLQHLTVQLCGLPLAATVAAAPPLPPIPRLQSFTWEPLNSQDTEALLPLASKATRTHLASASSFPGWQVPDSVVDNMAHLQRLTYLRLDGSVSSASLQALLQHPALEHLTVHRASPDQDFSSQPCRWRTFSVTAGAGLASFARLPLADLEQLTIGGGLARGRGKRHQCAAGVAALQRLHGLGRLALLPFDAASLPAPWLSLAGGGLISLHGVDQWLPALLRLVGEAGRGVSTASLEISSLPLSFLRGEIAPLLRGRIDTLFLSGGDDTAEEWCAGLLGALPPCIAHVKVLIGPSMLRAVTSLVSGGVERLRHSLTLTLLHHGAIGAGLEAELRQLAVAGRGGGAAQAQQQRSLLTLEVVRMP